MKKPISLLLSTCFVLSLISFTGNAQNKSKKSKNVAQVENAAATESDWREMDSFSQFLSGLVTAAKKGDLTPIRQNANELTTQSILLAKSEYPAVNDNVELRTILGEFTDRCEELSRFIQAGNADELVSAEVEKLERSFAEITHLRQAQKIEKDQN
ncbi:MAG TPA: hypothetical protein PKM97_06100 [Bacteroidia bacterium]|nr:hypothetical protein [Bacteroidia bacterium]